MTIIASSDDAVVRLVADVGGTNARFGLLRGARGLPEQQITLPTASYAGIDDAITDYLRQAGVAMPLEAAIAIANPVTGDVVKMSNCHWTFSIEAIRAELGLARLLVINDFTALAMSLPVIPAAHLTQLGGGAPVAGSPLALIGAGTGLGVSGLVPWQDSWLPLESEGGHVSVCASSQREADIIAVTRRSYPHVSAERLVSGMGLQNLYRAIAELDNAVPDHLTAAQVTERGLAQQDRCCAEALDVFCAIMGSVAGNLALTLGARGGVYIGGGIVPRLGDYFLRSPFRAAFEAKGRLTPYLAAIPAYVIREGNPALLGAAMALGVIPGGPAR